MPENNFSPCNFGFLSPVKFSILCSLLSSCSLKILPPQPLTPSFCQLLATWITQRSHFQQKRASSVTVIYNFLSFTAFLFVLTLPLFSAVWEYLWFYYMTCFFNLSTWKISAACHEGICMMRNLHSCSTQKEASIITLIHIKFLLKFMEVLPK